MKRQYMFFALLFAIALSTNLLAHAAKGSHHKGHKPHKPHHHGIVIKPIKPVSA